MKHGGMCICVLNSTLSEGLPVFEILRSRSNSSLLLPVKIIGPESIFPFVPFGNSYWPPRDGCSKRSANSLAYFASFIWLSFIVLHLSLHYTASFPWVKVLAISSALCLSFSSCLPKPIFPHQEHDWCSIYISPQLTWLFYRGVNSTVVLRYGSVTVDTAVRMTQHPKGQGGRNFIFTLYMVRKLIVEKRKGKEIKAVNFQPIMSHREAL